MPFATTTACRAAPDFVSELAAEFLGPRADRFVREDDVARCEDVLDHAEAQGKAEIQPDGMSDNVGRVAMAAAKWVAGVLRA